MQVGGFDLRLGDGSLGLGIDVNDLRLRDAALLEDGAHTRGLRWVVILQRRCRAESFDERLGTLRGQDASSSNILA